MARPTSPSVAKAHARNPKELGKSLLVGSLMFLALPLHAAESLDEGLFIPEREVARTIGVSGGEIVQRQKATSDGKKLKTEN